MCFYHIISNHSSTDGYLSCFYLLATLYTVANIGAQIPASQGSAMSNTFLLKLLHNGEMHGRSMTSLQAL